MVIKRVLLCLALLAPHLALPTRESTVTPTYKIVVNASNPVSTVTRAEATSYFLKRKAKWPNGVGVAPVDLSSRSPLRTAFCQEILGRSMAEVMHYWQQQIFSGGDTPPPVKGTDEDVISFVQSNPGGIGYLSAAAPLPKEVKSVSVSDR